MLDWSVALLDRLFKVLRHKDKFSKVKAGDLGSDTMKVAAAMTGLGGAGSGASGGGMQGVGMLAAMLNGGGGEGLLSHLIHLVTQQLLTMMDDPAGKMASAKILQFVMGTPVPNVEKEAAVMVEMVAWARPEHAVATLFPALVDGVLATSMGSDDAASLAPGVSPILLRWRLRMLSGLARGAGAALVPRGATVRCLIAAGIKHDDKSVRKAARKLLRKALHGLCELWPADTRSLPPARWANVNDVVEWRRLCEPVPPGEHNTVWIEPSAEGVALAAELLEEFLARPTQELSAELAKEVIKGDSEATGVSAMPAGSWREQLKTMDYAVRGGVCLLGDRETPGEDDGGAVHGVRDDVYLVVGSRCLSRLHTAAAGPEGPRLFSVVAGLRAQTARFLQSALDACAVGKGPADVKAAKLTVQLARRIACTRGAKAHHSRRQVMTLLAFKSQQRDVLSSSMAKAQLRLAMEAAGRGDAGAAATARRIIATRGVRGGLSFPRVLVIGRVSLQHLRRLALAPRVMAFAAKDAAGLLPTPDDTVRPRSQAVAPWPAASAVLDRYHGLFSALVGLSSAEYAMVRAAAQVGVSQVGGVYPWFVREAVPALIGRLSSSDEKGPQDAPTTDGSGGDAAHRTLTGACYMLYQTRCMRHVASRWNLLRKLLLALCDSQTVLARLPIDKQEKAAARVAILFTAYVSTWRANPIANDKVNLGVALNLKHS